MNILSTSTIINEITEDLRRANDYAGLMDFYRQEVVRLEKIRDTKPAGLERRDANVALGIAEFALLRLEMKDREDNRLAEEEYFGCHL